MLKTNSKKACENIRAYIMNDFDYINERANYNGIELDKDNQLSVISYAWKIFKNEKARDIENNYSNPNFAIFKDWAQGLALGWLFCYYYNRSAVDDLGAILEETEEEKARYTESQAEEMLTRLIYREMEKAAYPESAKYIFKEY